MSEAQFMRNVRMTLPEYISNVTLFKQAERILINKGIISEIKAKSPLTINGKVVKTYTQNSDKSYKVKYDEGGSETIMVSDKGWDDINTLRKNATNLSELKNTGGRYNLPNPDRQYDIYNSGRAVALRVNFLPNGKNYKEGDNIKRLQPGDKYEVVLNDQDKELLSIYPNHNQIIISQLKMGYTREDVIRFLNGKGIKPNEEKEFNDPQSPEDRQPEQGDSHYDMFKENNSLNEVKDTSATGYYNQDGKEQYSKFNELDNMNSQEIMAGYVMEKQDNPNIDQKEAVKLVIKNLKSDQFYYTNYKLTGIRGLQPTEFTSTKRKPFFDEMEEVNKNGDNFVDEKNKMIVVKEAKIEDVKLLLSDETLKNSQIGDSNGGVSIIYDDYKKIPYEDLDKLRNSFIVDEDKLSDKGETDVYQYYLSDKMNEVMKPNSKLKLKELVRKMMKEMFDGRDNLTDIE